MGTDKLNRSAIKLLSYPAIHPDAAEFLAIERKIKAIGLDTPSMDNRLSGHIKTHRTVFRFNIPGFANITNLDSLPATGTIVFALPMKIKGVGGAPLRIIAFVPNEQ